MLDGFLNLSLGGYVLATLILTHITIVAVTVFLHRSQAHRAVDLHPVLSHFFRFWLWLTTGMVTKEWVAVHRKHHAHTETSEDPHSPQVLGLNKVMLEGAELYAETARDGEAVGRFGQGTPDDWLERRVYFGRRNLGVTLMLFVDIFLFGLAGITIWAVQMLWIPFWAAGVVNGVGHYWGYRNYECADAATNIVPFGILIGGEELHNNHHAFPHSARLSSKWWEIDVGWGYIRLFSMLGLAKVRRISRLPHLDPSKQLVDLETVRAVVRNRLYVMARYARMVIRPVLRQELRRADASCREILKRARRALVREPVLVDENGREDLRQALGASDALRAVYEAREQLQDLWRRTTSGPEQMLKALQEWCTQAEASGIEVLQDFARSLRNFRPAPTPAG
jgi:stearoyl-CoA desaturase (delta-9 desaturase)